MPFVVELEPDVFLGTDHGDPGRTLVIDNAKLFRNIHSAKNGLSKAREFRPFRKAAVIPVAVRIERL